MTTTGHMTVGKIAELTFSSLSTQKANKILAQPLHFPKISYNKYQNLDPIVLAQKLNTISLAADWMDAIKPYSWKDSTLQTNFSHTHYLDTRYEINRSYKKEEVDQLVNQAIGNELELNVVNAISSGIKTLFLFNQKDDLTADEREAEQIALRALAHYFGDLVQPYHVADPIYVKDDGHIVETYGGNEIFIASGKGIDEVVGEMFVPESGMKKTYTTISEFHLFWDELCNVVKQIPEPYVASFDEFALVKWYGQEGLGGNFQAAYEKYIGELAHEIHTHYAGAFDPAKEHSLLQWTQDATWLGYQFLSKDKGITIIPQKSILKLIFDDIDTYKAAAKEAILTQVYLGGYYLGNILNAIYDPANAPELFQKLVKDIAQTDIPLFEELVSQPASSSATQKKNRRCNHKV